MIVIMMTTMTTMTVTGLSGLSLETFSKLDCKNFNLRCSYTDGKWYVRDNTGPSGIQPGTKQSWTSSQPESPLSSPDRDFVLL